MAIVYVTGGAELLDAVGLLWEKLNAHHAARSPYFAEDYAVRTFAERKAGLLKHPKSTLFRVELARDTETGHDVGYCVSLVTEDAGVVESIFIEADYRRQGIGDTLMQHALDWMDGYNVPMKQVVVAVGNEEAFGFYVRYGFQARHTVLQQV